MPVIKSCAARSPADGAESPPRKKFKFSLKLKAKRKGKAKSPIDSDSENESWIENDSFTSNSEHKKPEDSFSTKSTNGLSFGQELVSETVTPPLPYSGLANLGNTCYLNAVVQVLRYCPGFLKSLVNLDEISGQNYEMVSSNSTSESASPPNEDSLPSARPSIIHSTHKLSSEMENAEGNYAAFGLEANEVKNRSGWTTLAIRPKDFVKDFSGLCPLFSGYQQHDAQEFLRSFLSLVEEECVGLVKGEQQDNVKGNSSVNNNKNTKVRGGCKYPSTITSSVGMNNEGEPTKTMLAGDSTRIQPNNEIGWDDTGISANLYTTPRSVPKSEATCPDSGNIVNHLFEGTVLLQTCCLSCEGIRQRYENFQDISVPVQNTKPDKPGNNLSDSEDEADGDLNLSWAISKFASIERLNGDNKYFCDNCATLTEADISTYFEKLPQVLTIHLKRFQTSYGNQNLYSSSWVTKVTKSLHTPQQLSLKKWCSKTCSEKDAVYSLFGVVMHNGMSSCSGHYLSYVNVDILKKQAGSERKVDADGCSSGVQCEGEESMETDDGYAKEDDQCEVTNKATDHSVKCGSCQSSATKGHDRASNICQEDIPSAFGGEIDNQAQDEVDNRSFPCQTKNVKDENGDLLCKESLSMDHDDDDTCDYSEIVKDLAKQNVSPSMEDNADSKIKSDTQPHSCQTPSRNSSTDITKNNCDSDGSSDEDELTTANCGHIPRSMNITRYFKPIQKSEGSRKSRTKFERSFDQAFASESSHASSNRLNESSPSREENQHDSCSQTTHAANSEHKSKGDVKESRGTAFGTCSVSLNTSSSGESLNQESDRNDSCSQTKGAANNAQQSKRSFQVFQGQDSAFEDHRTSSNGLSKRDSIRQRLDRASCTQKTHYDAPESASSLKLMLDMEPSDELNTNQSVHTITSADGSVKAGLNKELTPDEPNTEYGYDSTDTTTVKCANPSANHTTGYGDHTNDTNHVAMHGDHTPYTNHLAGHAGHTYNIDHVEPSNTNGFIPPSGGEELHDEDINDSIHIGCSNQSACISKWLKFDDAEVQEISAKDMDEILSPSSSCYSTPYLLFYYRCS